MSDDVYGFVSTQADATPFTGVVAPSYPALSTAVSSLTAASLSKKITEMASAMNSTGVSTQKLTSYQTVSTSTLTGGSDTITLSDGTTFTSASVTGATVSSSSVTANMANSVGAGAVTDTDDYKFSLTNQQTGEVIVFDVMPQVNENRNVEYEPVAPPQFPGAFQKYRGTSSTTWQVNITLISRVSDDATANLRIINQLRSWTMPYYGNVTAEQNPSRIGAPPPVLIFKGLRKTVIGPVPVVITSLGWDWPNDVDYLPAADWTGETSTANIPFPVVMSVTIGLTESFSIKQFNDFSLNDFRNGDMEKAFKAAASATSSETVTSSTATVSNSTVASTTNTAEEPAQTVKSSTAVATSATSSLKSTINKVKSSVSRSELRQITTIVSGGGGDFGGGGASGDW
jgi:hypothetical protein